MSALENADVKDIEAVEDSGQVPPSEDFAHYLEEVPGTFIYVGAKVDGKETYPHHHPKFEINEDSLMVASKAMSAIVDEFVG